MLLLLGPFLFKDAGAIDLVGLYNGSGVLEGFGCTLEACCCGWEVGSVHTMCFWVSVSMLR